MADTSINILSLCSGTGMLDEGVCAALALLGRRAEVVGYLEREAAACANLLARMEVSSLEPAPVWCGDIKWFVGSDWSGYVDIITAGYPCQPFSLAGKRAGEDDERHIWPEVCRVIEDIMPSIIFLENVPGHLSLGFDRVHDELQGLGYQVAAGLFSSAEVGASHKRERLYILANRRFAWVQQPKTSGEGRARAYADRSSKNVADATHNDRRRGIGKAKEGARARDLGRRRSTSSGLGPYAPPLNDFDAWNAALRLDETLAPCIESQVRGMADGLASRADRLRLVGNGVDPMAAAYAFLCLLSGNAQ